MKKQKNKLRQHKTIATSKVSPEISNPPIQKLSPEDVEGLPDSVKLAVIQASSFSGPLPPPILYKEYEDVLPGAADRILAMAEKEQGQRHDFETISIKNYYIDVFRGQMIGGVIAVSCVVGATYCAFIGQPWIAGVLVGASMLNLVSGFIKGREAKGDDFS